MKAWGFVGIICAVVLHAGFLLFGGLLLPEEKKSKGSPHMVSLEPPAATDKQKEKPKEKEPPKNTQEVKPQDEPPPDAESLARSPALDPMAQAPGVEKITLADLTAALNGAGGGGDFNTAIDHAGTGTWGGRGKGGPLGDTSDGIPSMADIDQKPRVVSQSPPEYPSEMRGRKIDGMVTVVFVVDEKGKVNRPRAEKSNDKTFEKPALEAVKQWTFEPAVKGGQRVACKMRVAVRFKAN